MGSVRLLLGDEPEAGADIGLREAGSKPVKGLIQDFPLRNKCKREKINNISTNRGYSISVVPTCALLPLSTHYVSGLNGFCQNSLSSSPYPEFHPTIIWPNAAFVPWSLLAKLVVARAVPKGVKLV